MRTLNNICIRKQVRVNSKIYSYIVLYFKGSEFMILISDASCLVDPCQFDVLITYHLLILQKSVRTTVYSKTTAMSPTVFLLIFMITIENAAKHQIVQNKRTKSVMIRLQALCVEMHMFIPSRPTSKRKLLFIVNDIIYRKADMLLRFRT